MVWPTNASITSGLRTVSKSQVDANQYAFPAASASTHSKSRQVLSLKNVIVDPGTVKKSSKYIKKKDRILALVNAEAMRAASSPISNVGESGNHRIKKQKILVPEGTYI